MGDLPGAMPLDRPSLCQVAPLDTGTVRPRAKPSDDTGPFIDRNQRDSFPRRGAGQPDFELLNTNFELSYNYNYLRETLEFFAECC